LRDPGELPARSYSFVDIPRAFGVENADLIDSMGVDLEARAGIEPAHKGFAVFHPSPKPLKIPANSVE
jgi:hypothetical protein